MSGIYKLSNTNMVVRLADLTWIPLDAPGNRDYDAYVLWLEEGNIPDPADPPGPGGLSVAPENI